MNKNLMIFSFILSSLAASSIALADTEVTVKTTPTLPSDEIFVCNASRNFSDLDNNNYGNMTVASAFENTTYEVGSPFRSRNVSKVLSPSAPVLAPLNESFNMNISTLRFGISTEYYGASYNVYFCYRGPVKTQAKDPKTGQTNTSGPDETEGVYKLNAALSASVRDYADAANLNYTIGVTCDLRAAGAATAPRAAGELAPAGGVVEPDYFASWGNYDFTATRQIATDINRLNTQVPRFCFFKVTLSEKGTGQRPNYLNMGEFNVSLDLYK